MVSPSDKAAERRRLLEERRLRYPLNICRYGMYGANTRVVDLVVAALRRSTNRHLKAVLLADIASNFAKSDYLDYDLSKGGHHYGAFGILFVLCHLLEKVPKGHSWETVLIESLCLLRLREGTVQMPNVRSRVCSFLLRELS